MTARSEILAAIDAAVAALDNAAALVVAALPEAPPPAPQIMSATVSPSDLPFGGGSVTISAATLNATELLLDDQVIDRPLPWTVAVTVSHVYTLTARGPGGEDSVELFVLVADAPPAPPVDPSLGVITSKAIAAKNLFFEGFLLDWIPGRDPGSYFRGQAPLVVSPSRPSVLCGARTGGYKLAFGAPLTLTLTFDGTPVSTVTVAATDVFVTFPVDPATLAEGYYKASVTGLPADWSVCDYGVYVQKGAAPVPQARMPVVSGSYSISQGGKHHFAWVPAKHQPTIMPLVPRECPSFAEAPARSDLVFTQLVPTAFADTYIPCVTKDGLITTANRQAYFFSDFQRPKPLLPMLDGPRGRATLFCPTHLELGRAMPGPAEGWDPARYVNNVYFTDPWRVGKVRETGEVVTLAGWRHRDLAQFWNDPHNAELVGDWSAIPVERQGFVELWGLAWRVFATDYTHATIDTERGLRPHVRGVEAFVADQRAIMPNGLGRVVKLTFDPYSHAAPPKVTELNGDGWRQCVDVVADPRDGDPKVTNKRGLLWASDRLGHRIRILSMDTGAQVDEWTGIPQPEGLYFLAGADGAQDDWLYYTTTTRTNGAERGRITQFQIRRRNVDTLQDLLVWDGTGNYYINDNSLLFKIAVSDGTCGPRGMVAFVSWSNSYFGYPHVIMPDGPMLNWISPSGSVAGFDKPGQTYASAVALSRGRMLWGTATHGLMMASKRLPTDTVWDAAVERGRVEWKSRGRPLTHGEWGFGRYGLPLPWGESADQDAFLAAHGHVR